MDVAIPILVLSGVGTISLVSGAIGIHKAHQMSRLAEPGLLIPLSRDCRTLTIRRCALDIFKVYNEAGRLLFVVAPCIDPDVISVGAKRYSLMNAKGRNQKSQLAIISLALMGSSCSVELCNERTGQIMQVVRLVSRGSGKVMEFRTSKKSNQTSYRWVASSGYLERITKVTIPGHESVHERVAQLSVHSERPNEFVLVVDDAKTDPIVVIATAFAQIATALRRGDVSHYKVSQRPIRPRIHHRSSYRHRKSRTAKQRRLSDVAEESEPDQHHSESLFRSLLDTKEAKLLKLLKRKVSNKTDSRNSETEYKHVSEHGGKNGIKTDDYNDDEDVVVDVNDNDSDADVLRTLSESEGPSGYHGSSVALKKASRAKLVSAVQSLQAHTADESDEEYESSLTHLSEEEQLVATNESDTEESVSTPSFQDPDESEDGY